MNKCEEHDRYNCYDTKCKTNNTSSVSVNTDGNVALGIGSGLAIDLTDGSLGIQIVPGVVIDT